MNNHLADRNLFVKFRLNHDHDNIVKISKKAQERAMTKKRLGAGKNEVRKRKEMRMISQKVKSVHLPKTLTGISNKPIYVEAIAVPILLKSIQTLAPQFGQKRRALLSDE